MSTFRLKEHDVPVTLPEDLSEDQLLSFSPFNASLTQRDATVRLKLTNFPCGLRAGYLRLPHLYLSSRRIPHTHFTAILIHSDPLLSKLLIASMVGDWDS
jgi:hypothetical protein